MKISFCITIILFFSWQPVVSGQTFSDCIIQGPLFYTVEKAATFNGSFQGYFENEFKEIARDLNGVVKIKILIDSNGNACCMNITHNMAAASSTTFKEAVNKMTGWQPARFKDRAINFVALLQISFIDAKISVSYLNEKALIPKPVINNNTTNFPEIIKERKSNTVWKLWNFNNSMIPSDLSRNVAIDSNGVIWYCTDNGLVRIVDDDHWQIYNGMNVPALAGNNDITWTTGMAVDKKNHVWVKSFDHIVKFDGKKWVRFDSGNSPLKVVHKIYVDKNGITWFCTYQGLIKYEGTSWTKYTTANTALVSDEVKDVYIGTDETMWIATDKGINKVVDGQWSLFNHENNHIPDNDVKAIKGDMAGNVWAAAGTGDKYYLVKINRSNNISIFPSPVIWNITADNRNNKIWLATNGKGLVSFDDKGFTYYNKSNSIIPNDTVSDIVIDENGNKWISTFGGLVFTNKE